MICKCNKCKMILTIFGWWCPHKTWMYTIKRQLKWQKVNNLPKWLRKLNETFN